MKKIKCYFKNKSKIKKDSFNHVQKKKVNEKIILNLKIILKYINVNYFVIKFGLFLYLWRKRKKNQKHDIKEEWKVVWNQNMCQKSGDKKKSINVNCWKKIKCYFKNKSKIKKNHLIT